MLDGVDTGAHIEVSADGLRLALGDGGAQNQVRLYTRCDAAAWTSTDCNANDSWDYCDVL